MLQVEGDHLSEKVAEGQQDTRLIDYLMKVLKAADRKSLVVKMNEMVTQLIEVRQQQYQDLLGLLPAWGRQRLSNMSIVDRSTSKDVWAPRRTVLETRAEEWLRKRAEPRGLSIESPSSTTSWTWFRRRPTPIFTWPSATSRRPGILRSSQESGAPSSRR